MEEGATQINIGQLTILFSISTLIAYQFLKMFVSSNVTQVYFVILSAPPTADINQQMHPLRRRYGQHELASEVLRVRRKTKRS
jgi:hypothetical protein